MEEFKMNVIGEYYVDMIEEDEVYGIFNTETGHCYATFISESEAEEHLKQCFEGGLIS